MFIYPYRMGSNSVNELKKGLDARIIRVDNSQFKGGKHKNVINWGSSVKNNEVEISNVLNKPSTVANASNKKTFFNLMKGSDVSIPEVTNTPEEAFEWLKNGSMIVVREKLTGHSGEGIVLIDNPEVWENYNHNEAKLYVKYIPKKSEWRVHIFNDDVIDVQKKGVPKGQNPYSYHIQNRNNGFIFLRNVEGPPKQVTEQALAAFRLTGLNFGAIDVIFNEYRDRAYVLEVNTAPGLEGTTITNYINAFGNYFNRKVVTPPPEKEGEFLAGLVGIPDDDEEIAEVAEREPDWGDTVAQVIQAGALEVTPAPRFRHGRVTYTNTTINTTAN